MNVIDSLYEFITLAEKNRKYPANTAHGRRTAVKLFETVLHPDELESLELVKERMKEIYLSLISRHKDTFSMQSLHTYKGRFLNVIGDYQRYGTDPKAFARWEAKPRTYHKKDKDRLKDNNISSSSFVTHRHVHKIQVSLENGSACTLELPIKLTKKDAAIITKIIGSFVE